MERSSPLRDPSEFASTDEYRDYLILKRDREKNATSGRRTSLRNRENGGVATSKVSQVKRRGRKPMASAEKARKLREAQEKKEEEEKRRDIRFRELTLRELSKEPLNVEQTKFLTAERRRRKTRMTKLAKKRSKELVIASSDEEPPLEIDLREVKPDNPSSQANFEKEETKLDKKCSREQVAVPNDEEPPPEIDLSEENAENTSPRETGSDELSRRKDVDRSKTSEVNFPSATDIPDGSNEKENTGPIHRDGDRPQALEVIGTDINDGSLEKAKTGLLFVALNSESQASSASTTDSSVGGQPKVVDIFPGVKKKFDQNQARQDTSRSKSMKVVVPAVIDFSNESRSPTSGHISWSHRLISSVISERKNIGSCKKTVPSEMVVDEIQKSPRDELVEENGATKGIQLGRQTSPTPGTSGMSRAQRSLSRVISEDSSDSGGEFTPLRKEKDVPCPLRFKAKKVRTPGDVGSDSDADKVGDATNMSEDSSDSGEDLLGIPTVNKSPVRNQAKKFGTPGDPGRDSDPDYVRDAAKEVPSKRKRRRIQKEKKVFLRAKLVKDERLGVFLQSDNVSLK